MTRDQALRVIVVMGVAGAGKTSTGRALAQALGWTFYDADDFHSAANIAKMHRGEALTDDDRWPWLAKLRMLIAGEILRGDHAVLACSALKQGYRDALVPAEAPAGAVRFVQLDVPEAELQRRLAGRVHYFAPSLLGSQIATLELPADALRVDGARPVPEIVAAIRKALDI